jgi:hypothetical protein
MSKKAASKIMKGLSEALEIARGNAKPAKLHRIKITRKTKKST